MTREEAIKELMWSTGYGHGICRVANMFAAALARPDADHPDWPSIVTVSEPAEKYTDEELQKLVAFSREMTAKYDEIFSWRMGANLIVIDKQDEGRWLRKRQSWYMGPMYSPTLDEAMEVFR